MILLTGGAGYIGSHMLLALLQRGDDVVVLDNLSTGSKQVFDHVCRISGSNAEFVQGDIRDTDLLNIVFSRLPIDTVIHMAGLKSVSQSVVEPLRYYDNNVVGSINLLNVMRNFGVKKLLFASSISASKPCSPYAQSKSIVDEAMKDMAASDDTYSFISLRYSNPIGCYDVTLADTSQDNLLPAIMRVINGEQSYLTIFGNDYDTPDGTAMRDYVHILDVVDASLLALDYLDNHHGHHCLPVGSGKSTSVMRILELFAQQTNQCLPYVIKARRTGDTADSHCDISQACQQLGWQPKHSIYDAIASTTNFSITKGL
ncbi:UDP-glucose 4-epimerase GalE [Psychrobacter urativorans]|uniref:UDP-glucose 4-epimerase n=1 Tax=Psychrobacter urativorans TaxID=45610 RepID=A0A0M4TDQ6_9GAMM|nr:UDP-glucose 4-epimerase GalE [Psychrobacter urativorans]ALF60320.1 hypothetical protein AOC03_09950 [Psychrobacter urativorans]